MFYYQVSTILIDLIMVQNKFPSKIMLSYTIIYIFSLFIVVIFYAKSNL